MRASVLTLWKYSGHSGCCDILSAVDKELGCTIVPRLCVMIGCRFCLTNNKRKKYEKNNWNPQL